MANSQKLKLAQWVYCLISGRAKLLKTLVSFMSVSISSLLRGAIPESSSQPSLVTRIVLDAHRNVPPLFIARTAIRDVNAGFNGDHHVLPQCVIFSQVVHIQPDMMRTAMRVIAIAAGGGIDDIFR